MATTYRIATVGDMLKVPAAKRTAMLQEMELAVDLYEFTFGELAAECPLQFVDWTDDGDSSVCVKTDEGETIATLEVTKEDGS